MSAVAAPDTRHQPASYYGRPVLKQPVWTWEIPLYFVSGGVSGASAGLAFAARVAGNETLAKRTQLAAFGAIAVSAADLRPRTSRTISEHAASV